MKFVDTHSHFNLSQFDADMGEVVKRMTDQETGTFCVGVDFETSKIAVELSEKYENIWAIVGQHPTEWGKDFDIDQFRILTESKKVIGAGECGLDYYREKDRNAKEAQEKLFRTQIKLAIEKNLPLMLHIRSSPGAMDAYDDALTILKEYKTNHPSLIGTSHFFAGDTRVAKEFLNLGFYLSFAGPITFARDYDEVIKMAPIDRILSETDSPFASPQPHRGKRCEPAYVIEIVKKIAEIKDLPFEDVQEQLLQNAKSLFYKTDHII